MDNTIFDKSDSTNDSYFSKNTRGNPLISVIIPVYNTEQYVRECLDSVINQTFTNLEILVIDDGSTDSSGIICDEYKKDPRVQVFHTDNHGLSSARNLCLDHATGDYIAFVDSDDWIELNTYEHMLKTAIETNADIVATKICNEYKGLSIPSSESEITLKVFCDEDVIPAYASGILREFVWNKIYRADCFASLRFPVSHTFEDTFVMWELIKGVSDKGGVVTFLPENPFHYRMRKSSIAHSNNVLSNLTDRWKARCKRLEFLTDYTDYALEACFSAIGMMWLYYFGLSRADKKDAAATVKEMQAFSKANFHHVMKGSFPKNMKIICLLSQSRSWIVMLSCYCGGKICMVIKRARRKWYD